ARARARELQHRAGREAAAGDAHQGRPAAGRGARGDAGASRPAGSAAHQRPLRRRDGRLARADLADAGAGARDRRGRGMSDDKYAQSKPIDALNSRGLTGKREYVRGLEQRADAEALSLLIECLCDESWYLRDQAEQALLRLGPDTAGVLLPMLEQGL